jgi:branched-chain amino acid transport system substrate-binding protein
VRNSMQRLVTGVVVAGISLMFVGGGSSWASSSHRASKGAYKFGVIDATTGVYGVVGIDELDGIKLAVKQINASGGVNRHRLAYTLADDQGSVSLSTLAMKKFVLQDKLPVILGPGITPPAAADAPLAQKYGALEMNFVAQSTTWQGRSKVFAMVTPQSALADAMLKYMSKVDLVKNAYVLNANVVFGTLGAQELSAGASKYGITISGTNTWDPSAFDFTSQATAIVAANPPGVLLWGAGSSSDALVLAALRTAGYTGKIVGDITYSEQDIPQSASAAAPTVVGMSQINYAKPNALTAKFIKSFKAAYGHLPDYLAAASYDTIQILAKATKKSGSFTASALAKALVGLSYSGVNGSYAFTNKYHGGPGAGSYVPTTFNSTGAYLDAPTTPNS